MGWSSPSITPSRNVSAQIAMVERFIVSPFVKRIAGLSGQVGMFLEVQPG
jgi:hypothetical protein